MSRSEVVHTLAQWLVARHATIATAESCTGGNIVATLSSEPGASEWLHTGVVSYQRASKEQVLGLTREELSDGLVSEKTARAMAAHVRRLAGTTYALSSTGVCGPSKSEGIAPAAAWIGIATPTGTAAKWIELPDSGRRQNQLNITRQALDLLLTYLQESE